MQAETGVEASVLEALLDGPHFVCVHDAGSPIANFVSPGFLQAMELPAGASSTPDLMMQLVHPDDFAAVEKAWANAERGHFTAYEFRLRHPDGTYRWMSAVARAIPGASETPRFIITATDIDDRKNLERRLRLLVSAGEIFHESLNLEETLANVARVAVTEFSDFCIIDLLDDEQRVSVTAVAHRNAELQPDSDGVHSMLYESEFREHPVLRVARTGEPYFAPRIDEENIKDHSASERHAEFMRSMNYCSKIAVPVAAGGHVFGALTVVLTAGDRYFEPADLELALELGRRAGAAVANAREYTREQHVAATLQHAFIPAEFPMRPGLRFDGLYRLGKREAEIGGDWYDAFETRRGHIVVAIGDVTGKGVEAAQTMVQLRQAIRVASVRTVDPAAILQLANDALFVERHERVASVWVGVIPPAANVLHYATAGHPPPFLRTADGKVVQLPQTGQLLGISWECTFRNFELGIEPGMLLALYTDGLTEVTRDVTATEREIASVLSSETFIEDPHPAQFLERAIVRTELRDDLAIMTLQFG